MSDPDVHTIYSLIGYLRYYATHGIPAPISMERLDEAAEALTNLRQENLRLMSATSEPKTVEEVNELIRRLGARRFDLIWGKER